MSRSVRYEGARPCCALYVSNRSLKMMTVKADVEQEYQNRFDERHKRMVWQHHNVSSWYQNSDGKVVFVESDDPNVVSAANVGADIGDRCW